MTAPRKKVSLLRLSLRELLAIMVFLGVACVALKFANDIWLSVVAFAAILIFLAALIIALIDRGTRQAFAIGLVACSGLYGVLLITSREYNPNLGSSYPELDPYEGVLPTTKVLRPLFQAIVRQNQQTPIAVRTMSASQMMGGGTEDPFGKMPGMSGSGGPGGGGSMGMPGSGGPGGGGTTGMSGSGGLGSGGTMYGTIVMPPVEVPDRYTFMLIAHLLWGLVLGALGGHFGRFVYARRMLERDSAAADSGPSQQLWF